MFIGGLLLFVILQLMGKTSKSQQLDHHTFLIALFPCHPWNPLMMTIEFYGEFDCTKS